MGDFQPFPKGMIFGVYPTETIKIYRCFRFQVSKFSKFSYFQPCLRREVSTTLQGVKYSHNPNLHSLDLHKFDAWKKVPKRILTQLVVFSWWLMHIPWGSNHQLSKQKDCIMKHFLGAPAEEHFLQDVPRPGTPFDFPMKLEKKTTPQQSVPKNHVISRAPYRGDKKTAGQHIYYIFSHLYRETPWSLT